MVKMPPIIECRNKRIITVKIENPHSVCFICVMTVEFGMERMFHIRAFYRDDFKSFGYGLYYYDEGKRGLN